MILKYLWTSNVDRKKRKTQRRRIIKNKSRNCSSGKLHWSIIENKQTLTHINKKKNEKSTNKNWTGTRKKKVKNGRLKIDFKTVTFYCLLFFIFCTFNLYTGHRWAKWRSKKWILKWLREVFINVLRTVRMHTWRQKEWINTFQTTIAYCSRKPKKRIFSHQNKWLKFNLYASYNYPVRIELISIITNFAIDNANKDIHKRTILSQIYWMFIVFRRTLDIDISSNIH